MSMLFEYLYRDAGNFKALGLIALDGALALAEQQTLRSHFPGDGLFIAEQLGIPPLYEDLYQWSGGPTSSDHCWHEFVDVKIVNTANVPADAHRWGSAKDFLARLVRIGSWREELSPHFKLAARA